MTTHPKVTAAVDGDMEIELYIRRYHQLDGYMRTASAEMDEIKEKFVVRAGELHADQLTIGGRPVVSICQFERLSVKAADIKRLYPRIFRMFGSTTIVRRVDVR